MLKHSTLDIFLSEQVNCLPGCALHSPEAMFSLKKTSTNQNQFNWIFIYLLLLIFINNIYYLSQIQMDPDGCIFRATSVATILLGNAW